MIFWSLLDNACYLCWPCLTGFVLHCQIFWVAEEDLATECVYMCNAFTVSFYSCASVTVLYLVILHVCIFWIAFCQVCLILAFFRLFFFCLVLAAKGWIVWRFCELKGEEEISELCLCLGFCCLGFFYFFPKGLNFAKSETANFSVLFWQHSADNKFLVRATEDQPLTLNRLDWSVVPVMGYCHVLPSWSPLISVHLTIRYFIWLHNSFLTHFLS